MLTVNEIFYAISPFEKCLFRLAVDPPDDTVLKWYRRYWKFACKK